MPDYYAARLTYPQLFHEGFMARHVRAPGAALHCLCVDGRMDRDDIAAVTPTGHAHLSLTPRTYTRMGVTGAKTDRGALKFQATINLANPKFTPGRGSSTVSCIVRLSYRSLQLTFTTRACFYARV